ncbi:MAG: response regulator transcription factor [Planctomycetota bacterium]|jgi:CheY-like chemotaxis protein
MAYVLIVDDDEDFADAAATVLGDAGHDIQIELSTESALASMEATRPDLLILDVMFPEDTAAGFELARTIHQRQDLKGTPMLMLTAVNVKFPLGFSSRDIDDEWMPVSEFLEKPVDFDVLLKKVDALLAKAPHRAE